MKISFLNALLLALSTAGMICAVENLPAAEIQGVTVFATSGGAYTNLPDFRSANNLVSGVGIFGDVHTTLANGDMWWVNDTNTTSMGTNYVVFNLGGLYTVNAFKVWNYNDSSSASAITRGIKMANISYSVDGVNFITNLASQSFNEAPGTFSAFGQVIQMPSPIVAQYMRIDVVTNWGATNGVGLSKVRFISNTNPPAVVSAYENFGSNQVTIHFSESVDANSATNRANYSIVGSPTSPTISSIVMGPYADQVILHTSPLTNSGYTVSVSGVYDELFTATVTNNSTVPVQPELYLWLRSDVGVQIGANGNVTQWTDQSSYGHNAMAPVWLPPTTAGIENTSGPVLATGIVNGPNTFSSMQFFNTNVLGIQPDSANPLNGDITIFMVVEKTSAANTYGFVTTKCGGYNAGSSNLWGSPYDFYINNGAKPNFIVGHGEGNGTGASSWTTTTGISMNQFYLLTLSVTQGTNGVIYTNGAVAGKTTVTDPIADWGTPMYWGMRPNLTVNATNGYGYTTANSGFQGYLPEVMVIHGTVTPTDLTTITTNFGTKYGIPVVSQAIAEQPASATAQVGKTATFWVNVSGTPPTSYQWYSNNVSIAGATAAIYTTPPLTMTANNASYTVSLIGGAGITSQPATLTVVPDSTPPTISSATKTTGLTNVVVLYSEYVSPSTATNAANYNLNGGASVLSAKFGSPTNQVILTTTPLGTNSIYSLSVISVQDLYGNTIVGTTVPVMPTAMVLWLRADQGVVTNANSTNNPSGLDAWLDQSPYANNALGYTYPGGIISYRPTLGTDSVNGASSALFFGNYLSVPSSPSLAITGDMTVYVMVNVADYNAYHSILGKTTSASPIQPNPYDLYTGNPANGDGNLHFLRGNGTSSSQATAPAVPTGTLHLRTIQMSGGNVNLYLDGVLDASGPLSASITDGGQPLIIGSRNAFDIFMNGDMPEIMIFSNSISSADRTNVDDYLGGKYFPLVVTQAPVDITTNAGATATFSLGASQGSAHLTYQWLENGTNIPGANSSTYTTPVLAPGDSGESFSVLVGTPGYSSSNSGPAVLTVNNLPPSILSAGEPVWSSNTIEIVFSEAVLPATATNVANYSINGVTVLSATIGSLPNIVILTTSPLTQGTSYTLTVQNLQNFYNATMPAPVQVSTGVYPPMALWIKASSGVTADGSGNVSQWNDLSGKGNNLTDEGFGPPFDPLLTTNASGYPIIRFDATNETLLAAPDSSSLELTNDMTVFAVVNIATLAGGTNGEIIGKASSAGVAAPYDFNVNPSSILLSRGNGSTAAYVASTKAPSTGVTHLLEVEMQGTTVTHRLDGAGNGSGTLSTSIADTAQPVYIGTRGDGISRLTGDINEIILVGSALSSSDVASIESYLAGEYTNLTIVSPVNLNPTNLLFSVSNGQLKLSWPADHIGWQLQTQANPLSVGLGTNWVNFNPSTGTNQVVIPIDLTNGAVFYRLIYSP